ncbi:glycoside hydrolase family 2 TIM barrel-domain containing protein [uncultured Eubacterium sp.]|uniref:glycoside hydrolase family 2 TIM barrel-domain containing protein n=1 Tax=uncultured Eubacterium sp. TaxID=165185 RepID=UPI0015C0E590|nr:glycoside hydrolase family 2 TIM barrel-domain containing protein [uncultured Eubacterium sp.]
MIFKIKNDNYKSFDVFKENVLTPRAYFIPFSSPEEMAKTDIRTERYSSSMVDCLSGEWDFIYYKRESDLPSELDTDTACFDRVAVPSVWQHTGYEKPYYLNSRYPFKPNPPEIPVDCPVGVYHRTFNVDDLDKCYIISFLGVSGGLDVFVNGKYIGYSEGSHNTAEFEITDTLTDGENHLVVVNHKWTNGTYLECQDMFRDNGIFRDVLLYKNEKNSIYDFEAKITFNTDYTYNLDVVPALKLIDECELSATLFDGNELVGAKSVNVDSKQIDKITFSSLEVEEWSAEYPKLYTLVVSLSKGGEVIELIRRPVGFKHIKITGNVFTFNNKNIKLLGVNHHDTNPKTGYAMTAEDMEKDVRLFKDFNVNCVRTSHYPPDPMFLDLCDEYGIYVVDEADIETHGCETEIHRPGACSHNSDWQPRYWDRVYRMFQRDKNHASITMWSLGNEAHGYKNQDYCYQELKKYTDIPIHYEGVCRTRRWAYDVVSQMYPWFYLVERIAKGSGLPKKYYTKPYFMCEYAHAMGLGAGELETYVKAFLNSDNMLGGCIWEFADHAIYNEDGPYKYTYGGDHGENKHDGNFCVDGLFFPDRTPHSGALQMKNCYRPVRCIKHDSNSIELFNYKYFTNADYKLCWSYLVDGNPIQSGEIQIDIEPRKLQRFELDIQRIAGDQAITLRYFDGDFEVACEQIVELAEVKNASVDCTVPPTVEISERRLYVNFDNGSFVFDTATGEAVSYQKNGREYINTAPFGATTGFGIGVYRAPIDNDRNYKNGWNKLSLDTARPVIKKAKAPASAFSVVDNKVVITNDYVVKSVGKRKLCNVTVTYEIYGDGSVLVNAKCTDSVSIRFAPRFGLTLEMPRAFSNVEYYGMGDAPNVSDYLEHTLLGIYTSTVADMHEEYIKPQASSMRTGVRWARVTDDDGCGLLFTSVNDRVTFSADHYTPQQCAKANHIEELQDCNTTFLSFDSYHLGAGSNACGPVPSKEYKCNSLKGQNVSILVTPIE